MEHKTEDFNAEIQKFYTSEGGNFTMPDATVCVDCAFAVKNLGATDITGTPINGQTVNNTTSNILMPGISGRYVSDGANWFKF